MPGTGDNPQKQEKIKAKNYKTILELIFNKKRHNTQEFTKNVFNVIYLSQKLKF